MIHTKQDLNSYIQADYKSYKMQNPIISRITFGENWELFSYMRNLRRLEYSINKHKKYLWDYILWGFRWLRHRYNCRRLNVTIFPNTVGKGFHLVHRGFRRIDVFVTIGDNCQVLPNVLFGKKRPDIDCFDIKVGNNCYVSTGAIVLGPVNIGNNVTIAAGAVVTKDIPDNCTVAGVPAKIIKYTSIQIEK